MPERTERFQHKAFYDMYGDYIHIDKKHLLRRLGKETILINNMPINDPIVVDFGGATIDQALLKAQLGHTVLIFDTQCQSIGRKIFEALMSGDSSIATRKILGNTDMYDQSTIDMITSFYDDLVEVAQNQLVTKRVYGINHKLHEAPSGIADLSQFYFPFPDDFYDMTINQDNDILFHGLRVLKDNGSFIVKTEDSEFKNKLKLIGNQRGIRHHETVYLLNRIYSSVSDILNSDSPIYELVFFK